MRFSRLVAPAALLLATACLDVAEPSNDRVGLITARVYNNAGTPVLRGTATFYRVGGLQLQDAVPTPCELYPYDPNPVGASVPTLNAGNFITFSVAGSSLGADQIQVGSFLRYEMEPGLFLNFSSGDTVTVSVPGAIDGFEPTTIRSRLAEAFTVGDLPPFNETQPLELTWTAAVAPGSVMLVQMRYNTTGEGTQPNAEIVCIFTDDGTGSVPAAVAGQWVNANEIGKSILYTRVRESTVIFDARTRTRLRSFYDVPTPALVVPASATDGPALR